jgi:hypothetical protein
MSIQFHNKAEYIAFAKANNLPLAESFVVTTGSTFSLPANAVIQNISVRNATSSSVTDFHIGQTAGATDILNTTTCAANITTKISDDSVLIQTWAAAQPLNFTFTTAPTLTVTLAYYISA